MSQIELAARMRSARATLDRIRGAVEARTATNGTEFSDEMSDGELRSWNRAADELETASDLYYDC